MSLNDNNIENESIPPSSLNLGERVKIATSETVEDITSHYFWDATNEEEIEKRISIIGGSIVWVFSYWYLDSETLWLLITLWIIAWRWWISKLKQKIQSRISKVIDGK